jgi:hypothetical protein
MTGATETRQQPQKSKLKSEVNNMIITPFPTPNLRITTTRHDNELYENYYWVEPEELLA